MRVEIKKRGIGCDVADLSPGADPGVYGIPADASFYGRRLRKPKITTGQNTKLALVVENGCMFSCAICISART